MSIALLSNLTTNDVGSEVYASPAYRITAPPPQYGKRTFQIFGSTSAGAGTATATLQVSNDAVHWVDLAVMVLTLGTDATTDGFASDAVWENVRVYVDIGGISGTDGTISVLMGV